MRTTINLAPDVAAAVDELRRRRSLGVSEAVNELVRLGLVAGGAPPRFEQRTYDMGLGLDVSNVGEVIETMDGPAPP